MNNNAQDYYEELGTLRYADQRAIKDAYWQLTMKWHPDHSNSPAAD